MAPSLFSESFPPKPHWNVDDIPDLQGKVYAVTGGYGGIGYWTVVSISSTHLFLKDQSVCTDGD